MNYENILFDTQNGIARITLNRPEKLNSFTSAMHIELQDAIAHINADKSLRVLVLTGAGRGFCAGQDLADVAGKDGLGDLVKKYYSPLVQAIRDLPMPVIAAVNGVAAGAGANLALACDIVIAARSASFVEAFCRLGLIPDTGGTYVLPRLLGSARATGLAMLGDKLSAERAESWGLIWQCVDDDKLAAEVDKLATHFSTAPTLGLVRTKQAFQASSSNTYAQQLTLEGEMMEELGNSHDYHEGVAAFIAKRPPQFQGK
jgi:2-(1,2-epoxy-1,2-dihydrophenyl)acetyl-CoA isomerase